MRKILLVIIILFISKLVIKAQYDETDEMGVILSVGYKHLSRTNLAHTFDTYGFDFVVHNHFNNIDFNGSFQYGGNYLRNYISIEPFSLLGLLSFFFIKYGEGGAFNGGLTGLIVTACAWSSTGFNINIGDHIIIRPYWSLLRLSKIKDVTEKYTLNGGVGSGLTFVFGHLMLNPYCEYGFGYEKDSPFTGINYGVSLGVKLYD